MNFLKFKNLITKNGILLFVIFFNILSIGPIYYMYDSYGDIFIYLLISIEITILYFKITSKFKISSFSIENELKLLEYDENKYNKLVNLRSNFIVGTYSFISSLIFSGILFQSNKIDLIKKIGFVNGSFLFFTLSFLVKILYEYFLNQIKVYEIFLNSKVSFENMPIVYFGKVLVTAIMCFSFIILVGLLLIEI